MVSEELLTHMRDVVRCEASLRELNLVWRVIEMNARMNCPEESQRLLPMMAATRIGFESLQSELINSLVDQKIIGVKDGLRTQAQQIIDLIVRNLFERTADVGFLATDRTLCEFVAGLGSNRAEAIARLRAYRDKYTVYDDIVLLDLDGRLLANIGAAILAERADEPWIADTLQSDRYIETFRATALRAGAPASLLYSHRMLHPGTGQPVGVLCLVFGFDGEMADIFAARASQDERSISLLLDGDSRVIASSDEGWIARGAKLPANASQESALCSIGGRQYLARTGRSAGYEGYPGPSGWQSRVMVPVGLAFVAQPLTRPRLDDTLVHGLLAHAGRFCPPLLDIVDAAHKIRRVVWNGQVMTAGDAQASLSLKSVLEQITEAGARSDEVFKRSIQDLFDAALDMRCSSAESLTQLLVDLLDRNLYERSNDCRWWAMTPELRAGLAAPRIERAELDAMTAILDHINSLYTVYARLVVYDREGRIVTASHPRLADGSSVIGATVEDDTLDGVWALSSSQHYHVTPFRPSDLYDARSTYVYHAAIRAPADDSRIVGGIGVVFDAEPQFVAMLRSALEGSPPESAALFLDLSGRVISSTLLAHPIGSLLAIPAQLMSIAAGGSASHVTTANGEYLCVAAAASKGYREFKKTSGYQEDVLAVLLQPLGAVVTRDDHSIKPFLYPAGSAGSRGFATFKTELGLFALPVDCMVEALPGNDIRPVSLGTSEFRVGAIARRREAAVQGYVWVYDLNAMMGGTARASGEHGEVIILRHEDVEIGFAIGTLHAVPAFEEHQIVPAAPFTGARDPIVSHLIRANGGELLIQVLDPRRLIEGISLDPEDDSPSFEVSGKYVALESDGGISNRLQR